MLARSARSTRSLRSLPVARFARSLNALTSLWQQPQTHPDPPTTGAGASGLSHYRSVRAERYGRASAVFSACRSKHSRHCALLCSSALARGRLGYASPAASPSQRPPPKKEKQRKRNAPPSPLRPHPVPVWALATLRLVAKRAAARPIAVYQVGSVPRFRAFVSLLRGCPLAVCPLDTIDRLPNPRFPPLRGVGLVALLRPRSGAPVRPVGQSGWGLTPPVFFGCRPSSRPPATRVSRSRYPRSRLPRFAVRACARRLHSDFLRPSGALLGGKNAPLPAHRPLNNNK